MENTEAIDKKYDVMVSDELKFSDLNHIQNHLNYLFRTDKKQKWTNDRTAGNHVFFMNDRKPIAYQFTDNIDNRMQLRGLTENILKAMHVFSPKSMTFRNLRMTMLTFENPDLKEFDEEMMQTVAGILDTIMKNSCMIPVCAVTHQDQQGLAHFHIIAVNGSGKPLPDFICEEF